MKTLLWWIKSSFEDWSNFKPKDRKMKTWGKQKKQKSINGHFHQTIFYTDINRKLDSLYKKKRSTFLKQSSFLVRHHFIRNLFRRIGFPFICFVGSEILPRGNSPEKSRIWMHLPSCPAHPIGMSYESDWQRTDIRRNPRFC